jgi:hypothetical protein
VGFSWEVRRRRAQRECRGQGMVEGAQREERGGGLRWGGAEGVNVCQSMD